MKSVINGGEAVRTKFKAGELVQTGHGAVIWLLSDLPVGQYEGIHGIIVHSTRHPERVGRMRDTLWTSSKQITLFTGSVTLSN